MNVRVAVLALGAGMALSGCVVHDVVYRNPPPPPPVYADESVVTVSEPPPPLPVYEQPECPGQDYLWTPGYWAWNGYAYYWVPGTWVQPPHVGVLWTPGYWGTGAAGVFVFHAGYWGPHVGFYGGISYGYGYEGSGYQGGRWDGNHFSYNQTVNNVSYNGGAGTTAQPTAQEKAALREPHSPPTAEQVQHVRAASTNRALLASENHGVPPVAATPRAGALNDHAAVGARPTGGAAAGQERPHTGPEASMQKSAAGPGTQTEHEVSPASNPEAAPQAKSSQTGAPHPPGPVGHGNPAASRAAASQQPRRAPAQSHSKPSPHPHEEERR